MDQCWFYGRLCNPEYATGPQALHTHGRRLRVSMEGDAVSPTSPVPSPRGGNDSSFHNLQRTSWEQQRNRSFDSTRGRAQVCVLLLSPFGGFDAAAASSSQFCWGLSLGRVACVQLRTLVQMRARFVVAEVPSSHDRTRGSCCSIEVSSALSYLRKLEGLLSTAAALHFMPTCRALALV